MQSVELLNHYFWNEHTDLMAYIEPAIEEKFPDVWRWFEIRDHKVVARLKAGGASVYERSGFYWLGCPRDQDITDYVLGFVSQV